MGATARLRMGNSPVQFQAHNRVFATRVAGEAFIFGSVRPRSHCVEFKTTEQGLRAKSGKVNTKRIIDGHPLQKKAISTFETTRNR